MTDHRVDISKFFSINEQDQISITDPAMQQVNGIGFITINLSRANFSVLSEILTFDQSAWRLLVMIVNHFGITPGSLNQAIIDCTSAVQFRLLVKLCGELALVECVESLCRVALADLSDFRKQFGQTRETDVTPIHIVLREALGKMPTDAIRILEQYEAAARGSKRWTEMQIFRAAATAIRRRENKAASNQSQ